MLLLTGFSEESCNLLNTKKCFTIPGIIQNPFECRELFFQRREMFLSNENISIIMKLDHFINLVFVVSAGNMTNVLPLSAD